MSLYGIYLEHTHYYVTALQFVYNPSHIPVHNFTDLQMHERNHRDTQKL